MIEYQFSSRKWYLAALHEIASYWTNHKFQADELFAYHDWEDKHHKTMTPDNQRSIAWIIPRGKNEPKLIGTDVFQDINLEYRIKFNHEFDRLQSYDPYFPNNDLKDMFKFNAWLDSISAPLYVSKKKKEKK